MKEDFEILEVSVKQIEENEEKSEKIKKNLEELKEYVNSGMDDVQECVNCINSNLPAVAEKFEKLKELQEEHNSDYLKKYLKNDLENTISTMKELFENVNRSYIKLSENYEAQMETIQSLLDPLAESLDLSVKETHAKVLSKFSQADMNINAIQDSFINFDELFKHN